MCDVSPAGARVHGRAGACARVDRRVARAQLDVAHQRRLQRVVRLGRSQAAHARGADGRADVQRAPDRARAQGTRSGGRLEVHPGRPTIAAGSSAAFPEDPSPVTLANIVKAIAAFERTLVSGDSPLDRYLYRDDKSAMSAAALRGMKAFFSSRLEVWRVSRVVQSLGPRRLRRRAQGWPECRARVPQHGSLRRRRTRRVSADRSRPVRRHQSEDRHGPIPRADAAQYRRDGALHARRQRGRRSTPRSATTRPAASEARSEATGCVGSC